MNSDLASSILNAALVALIPVLVSGLAYVARAVVNYVRARTTVETMKVLTDLSRQAVLAVEQTMKSKAGQERLAAAQSIVTGALMARGLKVDLEQVTSAIEAAVYVERYGITIDVPAAPISPAAVLPEISPVAETTGETGA